jgi:hypothetical protein
VSCLVAQFAVLGLASSCKSVPVPTLPLNRKSWPETHLAPPTPQARAGVCQPPRKAQDCFRFNNNIPDHQIRRNPSSCLGTYRIQIVGQQGTGPVVAQLTGSAAPRGCITASRQYPRLATDSVPKVPCGPYQSRRRIVTRRQRQRPSDALLPRWEPPHQPPCVSASFYEVLSTIHRSTPLPRFPKLARPERDDSEHNPVAPGKRWLVSIRSPTKVTLKIL